jgi:hypothetical protein
MPDSWVDGGIGRIERIGRTDRIGRIEKTN